MAQEFIHLKSRAEADDYLARGYVIVENTTAFAVRLTQEGADLAPRKLAAMKEWDHTIDHWLAKGSIVVMQRDSNKAKAKNKKTDETPAPAEPEPAPAEPEPAPAEPTISEDAPSAPESPAPEADLSESDITSEVQENG